MSFSSFFSMLIMPYTAPVGSPAGERKSGMAWNAR